METTNTGQLEPGFDSEVLAPGTEPYEERRKVWNGTIDRKPALIVLPRSVAAVQAAVNFARRQGLRIAVRGGGHHVAGDCMVDGAVVLDMAEMRAVSVDTASGRVRAQGGARLGDIDQATAPHQLAVPLGVVSKTGVAGLSLAGGLGWLRREHGYTADNLVAAEVVTADGRILRASEDEDRELLWALRGGGWGLGVVTAFEFQAHSLPAETAVILVAYPIAEARKAVRAYQEVGRDHPKMGALAVLGVFPEAEAWPREVWGQPFVLIIGPYAGDPAEGERVMQPLRELGNPLLDMSGRMPFVDAQKDLFDADYPDGKRYYWKSVYLTDLPDAALDTLTGLAQNAPSHESTIDLWLLGGALSTPPSGGSPLDEQRSAAFLVGIEANWDEREQDAANRDWTRAVAAAMQPYSTGGSYLNFEDLDEEGAAVAARGANQARLRELKRRLDPDGLFHARKGLLD